jgi:fido (protein-threonine AMPylation protein)
MAKYEGQDHYLDPETGVLKNKLGIRDEEKLKRAEASLVAWRSFELLSSFRPKALHFIPNYSMQRLI